MNLVCPALSFLSVFVQVVRHRKEMGRRRRACPQQRKMTLEPAGKDQGLMQRLWRGEGCDVCVAWVRDEEGWMEEGWDAGWGMVNDIHTAYNI